MTPTTRLLSLLALPLALQVSTSTEAYKPQLGELMTLTQMRQAKLWYAGEAHNWPLAVYELDELKEGFGQVVAWHGEEPGLPLPPSGLVPIMIDPPLARVREAVEHQDAPAFEKAFDALTEGCNSCHQASDHGFIVIRRPAPGWFGNQEFAPAH